MAIAMQVTLGADKDYVLPLYMPSKKDTGILRNGSPSFTCKTRTLFPSSLLRHNLQELEIG